MLTSMRRERFGATCPATSHTTLRHLPDSTKLPEVARIVAAHGELGRVDEIERAAQAGNIPYMNPDLETARRLRDWVVVHKGFMTTVKQEQWLFDAYHALLGLRPLDPAPLKGFERGIRRVVRPPSSGV